MDYEIFVNCLIGCAEINNKNLSEHVILLYWNTLKHLEIDVVVDAFNRYLVNPDCGQFMPKPADIIRLCKGSYLDSAMLAWTDVLSAIKSIGRYESVVFGDSATMTVVRDMGGWIALCKTEDKEIPFKAREFQTRYKNYKTVGSTTSPCKLIGVSEASNCHSGRLIAPPVLIGDVDVAKNILSGNLSVENNPVLKKVSGLCR